MPARSLVQNEENGDHKEDDDVDDSLPDSIPWLSHSFPFGPNIREVAWSIRARILACLPEVSQAKELSEFYFQHAAWMFVSVTHYYRYLC